MTVAELAEDARTAPDRDAARPVLRSYQHRVVESIFSGWDAGLDRVAISMATGGGKAHPLDVEIPTPDGLRKFGDLAIGDRVFGSDGVPTTVTGVFDRGVLPVLRVTFSDRTSVRVDGDHLWRVKRRWNTSPWQTIATRDLAAGDLRDGRSWRWRIPMAGAVQHPHADLPIPPYTLGAYLANGSHGSTTPSVTTPDMAVRDRVTAEGVRITEATVASPACPRFYMPGLGRSVQALGLAVHSADKFIPRAYLESSTDQRTALLRGLMDADGSSRTGGRRSVCYHTTSPRLVADVQELVWSLGGTATVIERERPNRDKPGTYRDIKLNILTPAGLYPFGTERKDQDEHPARTFVPTRAIVAITPEPSEVVRCISVSAPDRLYLIGREHIVTHNSVVFGEVCRRHLTHHDGPVLLLTHRRELVEQAAGHFRRAAPDLRVLEVIGSPGPPGSGKRSTALRRWRRADVLVSTVQTLASANTRAVFPDPSLIIVDESHHAMAQSWTTALTALGAFSGAARCLGVTATPFREDHRSFGDVWQAVVSAVDISWLISHGDDAEGNEGPCRPGQGYLVPPTLRHLTVDGLNLAEVPTSVRSGSVDYRETELAAAMAEAGAFDLVARAIVAELADRKGAVFAPTVASSREMAARITAAGLAAEHLDGDTPKAERKAILDRLRTGATRWLCNVGIISEGFDVPDLDAVVLARPTRSRILFRQAVGRALRPAPGKSDAIVLDVVGASDGHTLAGVEALTDTDVLTAASGENLAELLSRSERARAGRRDRITAHVRDAQDVQARAERAVEQVVITAEAVGAALPGLAGFPDRARDGLHPVLDHTTVVTDAAASAGAASPTLDELAAVERTCADELAAARTRYAELERIKDLMRDALAELREDPEGEVARALVTGKVATVRGQLFGEAPEWIAPGAPGGVGALQVRGGGRSARPTHPARFGWLLRSPAGHLYAPIQIAPPGEQDRAPDVRTLPDGLVVAAALPPQPDGTIRYLPVTWSSVDNSVDELAASSLADENDAYRLVIDVAMESTAAPNLLNPGSAWRRKPSPTGNGARAMARRVAPTEEIPDDATAGYVSDVISTAKFGPVVDRLGAWVIERTGAGS